MAAHEGTCQVWGAIASLTHQENDLCVLEPSQLLLLEVRYGIVVQREDAHREHFLECAFVDAGDALIIELELSELCEARGGRWQGGEGGASHLQSE